MNKTTVVEGNYLRTSQNFQQGDWLDRELWHARRHNIQAHRDHRAKFKLPYWQQYWKFYVSRWRIQNMQPGFGIQVTDTGVLNMFHCVEPKTWSTNPSKYVARCRVKKKTTKKPQPPPPQKNKTQSGCGIKQTDSTVYDIFCVSQCWIRKI